jgi:hypothetical protein
MGEEGGAPVERPAYKHDADNGSSDSVDQW